MMLKHLTKAACVAAALMTTPILMSSAQAAGWESHNQPYVVRPYDGHWRGDGRHWRRDQDRRDRYSYRRYRDDQDRRDRLNRYSYRLQREDQDRRNRYSYRLQRQDEDRRDRYREYLRDRDRNDGPAEFLQNLFNQ